MLVVKNVKTKERTTLDSFQVGDGVYDTDADKLYIVAHDYESADQLPGKVLDKAPEDDDDDDDDEPSYDFIKRNDDNVSGKPMYANDDEDDDDSCDDDDDDYDDNDDDSCDDDDDETSQGYEHGYFIFDPATANQVTRLHRTSPRAAIKAYFINGLKHNIIRIPAEQLKLVFDVKK